MGGSLLTEFKHREALRADFQKRIPDLEALIHYVEESFVRPGPLPVRRPPDRDVMMMIVSSSYVEAEHHSWRNLLFDWKALLLQAAPAAVVTGTAASTGYWIIPLVALVIFNEAHGHRVKKLLPEHAALVRSLFLLGGKGSAEALHTKTLAAGIIPPLSMSLQQAELYLDELGRLGVLEIVNGEAVLKERVVVRRRDA